MLTNLAGSDEGEYALEAACCKVFASEMLWRAADEMVQLAGGRGRLDPTPQLLRFAPQSASEPVAKVDAGSAAQALDAALSRVLLDMVRWVGTGR